MLLKKGSTVQEFETQFKKSRRDVLTRARKAQATLDKVKSSLEETGLIGLIPHAVTTSTYEQYVTFKLDGDTLESRRIAHPFIAASGLEWKPSWDVRIVEWCTYDSHYRPIYHDKMVRTCQLDAKHDLGNGDRIWYTIEYGDGPEVKEGDKLPSGCKISVSYNAQVAKKAATCEIARG